MLKTDTIKHAEIKEKLIKLCLRRTRKLLETNLFGRNFTKRINTLQLPVVRYSGLFLKYVRRNSEKWTERQGNFWLCTNLVIQEMRTSIWSGKTEEEDSPALRSSYQSKDKIRKSKERLIKSGSTSIGQIKSDIKTTKNRKQKWVKTTIRKFQAANEFALVKTWTWIRKGSINRETESHLIPAQNNDLRTIYIEAKTDNK